MSNESAFPYEFGNARREKGMTLRDYFAAAALQGLCANNAVIGHSSRCGWEPVNCSMKDLAISAYGIADLMLETRD